MYPAYYRAIFSVLQLLKVTVKCFLAIASVCKTVSEIPLISPGSTLGLQQNLGY